MTGYQYYVSSISANTCGFNTGRQGGYSLWSGTRLLGVGSNLTVGGYLLSKSLVTLGAVVTMYTEIECIQV